MNNAYKTINIVLADDQEIIRQGFRSIIESEPSIKIVAEAANGTDLVNLVALHRPDVVLTDIKMPGMNGVEATIKILESFPGTVIMAFTIYSEDYMLLDMLTAGAIGYILKDAGRSEIIEAIQTVHKNQPYYCRNTNARLTRLIAADIYDPIRRIRKPRLSQREKEVLILICRERSNEDIAFTLGISKRTVEIFRKKLVAKCLCRNSAGLVSYAVRHGLWDPGNLHTQ